MATLAPQQIIRTGSGLEPTYAAAAAGGDKIKNEAGRLFLFVKNVDSSGRTVTLDVKGQVDGLDVTDPTFTVPPNEERMIGAFPSTYEDTDGFVNITYDDESFVTVACIRL